MSDNCEVTKEFNGLLEDMVRNAAVFDVFDNLTAVETLDMAEAVLLEYRGHCDPPVNIIRSGMGLSR